MGSPETLLHYAESGRWGRPFLGAAASTVSAAATGGGFHCQRASTWLVACAQLGGPVNDAAASAASRTYIKQLRLTVPVAVAPTAASHQ